MVSVSGNRKVDLAKGSFSDPGAGKRKSMGEGVRAAGWRLNDTHIRPILVSFNTGWAQKFRTDN